MQTVPAEAWTFLEELDAWIERGRPAYEFAALKGIANGTVTYRLHEYGLKQKRCVGLLDKRTGAPFREVLVRAEEVKTTDAAAPVGA